MPIEFRCTQCQKLLRTGDDTGGRQAQCPQCGTIVTVPAPDAAPPGASASPNPWAAAPGSVYPAPSVPGGSPFGGGAGGGPPAGNPFDAGGFSPAPVPTSNPYASPLATQSYTAPGGRSGDALEKVSGPATALLVMGYICVGLQVLGMIAMVVMVVAAPQMGGNNAPQGLAANAGINLITGVFGLAMSGLIIYGASQMKKLENYGMSMAAAIIAMVPCFSPCCILGLPFGIWALTVLNDPDVKSAFR